MEGYYTYFGKSGWRKQVAKPQKKPCSLQIIFLYIASSVNKTYLLFWSSIGKMLLWGLFELEPLTLTKSIENTHNIPSISNNVMFLLPTVSLL